MGDEFRASVRVVCLDSSARVLLLQWRDPSNGELLWEPPGGGIEIPPFPLAAAANIIYWLMSRTVVKIHSPPAFSTL